MIIVTAVCAIVAATHRSALSAKALSFDDRQYFVKNVLVQNPGWASAKRLLTEVLEPSTVQGYYQPLTMVSLMLDDAAGGRENNLLPFHITSLALHTVNTALVIVLLYLLFGNIWAAAAAGMLFGVHPMTVEPVTWVGERKTLLAAFFSFWSLICYVRFVRSGGWKSYTACFVMYLLALMSKPTSTPLPMVMLLMDYWPLERIRGQRIEDRKQKAEYTRRIYFLVLEKIPLFILGIISAVITYISQHRTAGTVSPIEHGRENVLLVLCHDIIFYLYKIVLPVNLSSHYAFPKPFGLSNAMVLTGVIGTCILIPLLLVSLRWTRAALTGWLIFFVAIFPAMQIIRFSDVIASDKFAYMPSIGLVMIVTSFLIWFGRGNKIRIAAAVVVLILACAEAVATQRYLVYWQDSLTLTNHMLALAPDAAPLYYRRGNIYAQGKGEYDLAISDYNRAIEINPLYANAYNTRGNAYAQGKGEYDLAISDYNRAIEINPRSAIAYFNRGNAYAQGKDMYDRAIGDYSRAVEINPTYADAYYNRGLAYKSKGQLDSAISDYSKAIEINPADPNIYNNRGNAYKNKGQYDLAISDYNKTIEINPKYCSAYFNKASVYEETGRKKEAIESYKNFIRYALGQPQWTLYIEQANYNLGCAYEEMGRWNEAIEAYKQAIKIKPSNFTTYNNLGAIYAKLGQWDEAAQMFKEVLKLKPDNAFACYNLGNIYGKQDHWPEAAEAFRQTTEINPKDAQAHFRLGIAYFNMGKKDLAIKQYEILKNLDPQLAQKLLDLVR